MKNEKESEVHGTTDNKGYLAYVTRNIRSMGLNPHYVKGYSKRAIKKAWHKKEREFSKLQTKKEII